MAPPASAADVQPADARGLNPDLRSETVAPARTTPATHTVRRGDTVWAIATRYGLKPADVLAWNGLGWSSVIYPGQVLTLRPPHDAPRKSPSTSKAKSKAAAKYRIVRGDTVWAIATRHGLTVDAVLKANGLSRASIIYPGQTLVLPGVSTTTTSKPSRAAITDLDAEQRSNARLIIKVGRKMGVPDRGIAIALGTAMQESWLRNLDWGDRDSLGLFQQRPSTGWGTAEQVRDRERATRAFFGGPQDPNGNRTRGLLDIPGWQKMSFAQAAQAVQISAYPDRYARWEDDAYAWLAALG